MILQCLLKPTDAVDHVRISVGTQKWLVLLDWVFLHRVDSPIYKLYILIQSGPEFAF